jgi:hypothetical protein
MWSSSPPNRNRACSFPIRSALAPFEHPLAATTHLELVIAQRMLVLWAPQKLRHGILHSQIWSVKLFAFLILNI